MDQEQEGRFDGYPVDCIIEELLTAETQLKATENLRRGENVVNTRLLADLQSERERIDDLQEINDSLVRQSNKRIAELETKNKYYKSVICDRCANERTSEICHECPYRKE